MSGITKVWARQILDSRGNPTVEVELSDSVYTARAAVPSGASTGVHEALELRDGDENIYGGKGVLQAVEYVNGPLAEVVMGLDPQDQSGLDRVLLEADGTENKSKYGANALLGISLAAARLGALQKNMPLWQHIQELYGTDEVSLPKPMMNILNGGAHADSGLAIQEFMVMPQFDDFAGNLRAGAEIFHVLKKILRDQGHVVSVGDEGGFAPHISQVSVVLDTVMEAITTAGYDEDQVKITLDAAASEFYNDGVYSVDDRQLSADELTDFYADLCENYPIISIEDSHHEDDFAGFASITSKLGTEIQLVGDDLFVTNKKRLKIGIDEGMGNSILIKVNQIGTLSETFETMKLATNHGYTCVISHRSGETEDDFIADLAVGTNAGQIKTGSLCRGERTAKYNQLLRISEQL